MVSKHFNHVDKIQGRDFNICGLCGFGAVFNLTYQNPLVHVVCGFNGGKEPCVCN